MGLRLCLCEEGQADCVYAMHHVGRPGLPA